MSLERNLESDNLTAVIEWPITPTAHDNSGDIPHIICNYVSGTNFTLGVHMVNCVAVDGSGNKGECHFQVSIFKSTYILFLFLLS